MRRWLAVGAGIAAITLFGFFVYPGHTYLQSDTQIYAPVIEWLRDPSLYKNDQIPRGAHVSLTIYDEAALALRAITGDLQTALVTQQLLYRALGVLGIFLIATGCGIAAPWAMLAAALSSLGANIIGPAVLTIEYEPVPRGFAVGLTTFALGLMAHGRWWAAGAAAALAFLYHAPAVWPFWLVAVVWTRRRELFVPLAVSVLALIPLAWSETRIAEQQSIFATLAPDHAELQQLRASYNWISIWFGRYGWFYFASTAIGALALWRVRPKLPAALRPFFVVLPILGLATMPASYWLLEQARWALLPQLQPMRALLFTVLCAIILCALAAAISKRWRERVLWTAAALWFPLFPHHDWRKALTPPALKDIRAPRPVETPELAELSAWAKSATSRDATFLFPDADKSLPPGVFRARAERAVYTCWKAGGQVNYFPIYAREWWRRWNVAMAPPFTPERVPALAALGIDYLVVTKSELPGQEPVWRNAAYRVYRIR